MFEFTKLVKKTPAGAERFPENVLRLTAKTVTVSRNVFSNAPTVSPGTKTPKYILAVAYDSRAQAIELSYASIQSGYSFQVTDTSASMPAKPELFRLGAVVGDYRFLPEVSTPSSMVFQLADRRG